MFYYTGSITECWEKDMEKFPISEETTINGVLCKLWKETY